MKSIVWMSFLVLGIAVYLPGILQDRQDARQENNGVYVSKAKRNGPAIAKAYRGEKGHFSFNASLNGSHEKVLVDTGATIVAINWRTARRIGIELDLGDFTTTINTANGQTKAASAYIDEVRIDDIVVRNVRAAVLQDDALSGTLLGMSFLNKLKRFEIEGSTLKLTQ